VKHFRLCVGARKRLPRSVRSCIEWRRM